jgi:hypothetical protein
MRSSTTGALIVCLAIAGCSDATLSDITIVASTAPPAPVEVFINNHDFGPLHGCTSMSAAHTDVAMVVASSLTCGLAGAVSKVTWKLIRSDDRGDWYRFERTFPYGETDAQTTHREVVFEGSEIVVFEDDVQRVIMRPSDAHHRPPET